MPDVLNFPGDRTDFDPTVTMGPDQFGGFWAIKSATYDHAADRTTVQLRPVPPAELPQRMAFVQGLLQTRLKVMRLFGGGA